MEVAPGIYRSAITTEDWETDVEVNGETHYLCNADGVEAGMTRYRSTPAEPVLYRLPKRETLLVLEGEAEIEIAGGPTLMLRAGDMASIPEGSETTWRLKAPYKEFWTLG